MTPRWGGATATESSDRRNGMWRQPGKEWGGMSHDEQAGPEPGRRRAPRWARVAMGAAVVLALGVGLGIRLNHGGHTTVPDCGARGPSGPTPCRFPCVHQGGALGADHREADDWCLYDPAATTTTATFGPPPTTSPSNGSPQPVTPRPAAGG